MRALRCAAIAALVAVVGCTPSQIRAATSSPTPAPVTTLAPSGPGGGSFKTTCTFSHRLTDDPIVHPGMAMMSHSHDFFGNTTTNAATTAASLRAGSTTCDRPEDRSAYWIPTVSYGGTATTPIKLLVYYVGRAGRTEQPIPAGLEVVAGKAMATAPQSTSVVGWRCGMIDGVQQPYVDAPPSCPPSDTLNLRILFPNCWDGVRLDSADHASHLSYDVHRVCDAAHPINLPIIAAEYFLPNPAGAAVTLASGAAYTLHGDFFSGWDQSKMTELVRDCVNRGVNCGSS